MTNHPNRSVVNGKREYRVRLEWVDGRVTHTFPVGNRRKAEKQVRDFAEVALMSRTYLELSHDGQRWLDAA